MQILADLLAILD